MLLNYISCAISSKSTTPPACSVEEHKQMPCVCCKKDCWYTVAAVSLTNYYVCNCLFLLIVILLYFSILKVFLAATHELGHMPGEAGEREALATLRLIRACMISDCAGVCLARVPF
uniref:Uncharacterized protein n=1 Tax=Heterorhabditis bacteriophora TaxID=37862 RepID=A0A1I7X824_HETBA